jgi:hypothetical protein
VIVILSQLKNKFFPFSSSVNHTFVERNLTLHLTGNKIGYFSRENNYNNTNKQQHNTYITNRLLDFTTVQVGQNNMGSVSSVLVNATRMSTTTIAATTTTAVVVERISKQTVVTPDDELKMLLESYRFPDQERYLFSNSEVEVLLNTNVEYTAEVYYEMFMIDTGSSSA